MRSLKFTYFVLIVVVLFTLIPFFRFHTLDIPHHIFNKKVPILELASPSSSSSSSSFIDEKQELLIPSPSISFRSSSSPFISSSTLDADEGFDNRYDRLQYSLQIGSKVEGRVIKNKRTRYPTSPRDTLPFFEPTPTPTSLQLPTGTTQSSSVKVEEIEFLYPSFTLPKPKFIRATDLQNFEDGDEYTYLNYCFPDPSRSDPFGLCVDHKFRFPSSKFEEQNEFLEFNQSIFTRGRFLIFKEGYAFIRRSGCSNHPNDDFNSIAPEPDLPFKYSFNPSLVVTRLDIKLVFLYYPLCWQFQHFLDGALPKVMQVLPYLHSNPDAKIIFSRKERMDKLVYVVLDRLGVKKDRVIDIDISHIQKVNEFVWPCKAPNHPYLWRLASQLIREGELKRYSHFMKPHRRRVIWISRNQGPMRNSQRSLAEEPAFLAQLREYLKVEREGREELTVYPMDFPATAETLPDQKGGKNQTYLSIWMEGVVVIGTHGGGMYNTLFVPPGAIVIELMPYNSVGKSIRSFFSFDVPGMFANYLQHVYYRVHVQSTDKLDRVVLPEGLTPILDILRKELPLQDQR